LTVNISPLINDYDKVVDIVETKILSSRNELNIALDTQKQYYLAIIRLTQKNSPLQIPKAVRSKYTDKLQDVEQASNKLRNTNEPKRGNALHRDFTWSVAQAEYETFITTHSFTNTGKGRKDLRNASISGLYVLQRPRRVTDYWLLQYYSKKTK
jgi:hypothetical protein